MIKPRLILRSQNYYEQVLFPLSQWQFPMREFLLFLPITFAQYSIQSIWSDEKAGFSGFFVVIQ